MANTDLIHPPLSTFTVIARFHGPTNYKGSRVSASLRRGSDEVWRCYQSWDYRLSNACSENYISVGNKLIAKHWPEPDLADVEAHTEWQLTIPRLVAMSGHDPDCYHLQYAGAWQFNAAAAWLIQQRNTLNLTGNTETREAVL